MICNGSSLLTAAPIIDMLTGKERSPVGVSHGLAEAGYDIRIAETIVFKPGGPIGCHVTVNGGEPEIGRFIKASTMETFNMPSYLVGIVHDKSTWAREGLSVFNTVIEPGWRGILTLEMVFHGQREITIPAGSGIAQVIFHRTMNDGSYNGKYQDQPAGAVPARYETGSYGDLGMPGDNHTDASKRGFQPK